MSSLCETYRLKNTSECFSISKMATFRKMSLCFNQSSEKHDTSANFVAHDCKCDAFLKLLRLKYHFDNLRQTLKTRFWRVTMKSTDESRHIWNANIIESKPCCLIIAYLSYKIIKAGELQTNGTHTVSEAEYPIWTWEFKRFQRLWIQPQVGIQGTAAFHTFAFTQYFTTSLRHLSLLLKGKVWSKAELKSSRLACMSASGVHRGSCLINALLGAKCLLSALLGG